MDSIPSELLPNAKALYVQRCVRLVCLHGEMLEYRLITNVNWVLLESLCITGDMENADIFLSNWVWGRQVEERGLRNEQFTRNILYAFQNLTLPILNLWILT